jgi:hypothetical protein
VSNLGGLQILWKNLFGGDLTSIVFVFKLDTFKNNGRFDFILKD